MATYEVTTRRWTRIEYEKLIDLGVFRLEDYRVAHPSRPALTVEVAESSLDGDRGRKGGAYAMPSAAIRVADLLP